MSEEINWIDEMIEREALPKQLRIGTNAEFCQAHGIVDSNYYYHSSKPEIKAKIVEIALNNAKRHAPEVLENLGERAKENSADTKLYLQFILQLAEKTNVKVDLPTSLIEIISGITNKKPDSGISGEDKE